MSTWKQGISDSVAVLEELIQEYDQKYRHQRVLIEGGIGSPKLAADWSLVISALERGVELIKDIPPPLDL